MHIWEVVLLVVPGALQVTLDARQLAVQAGCAGHASCAAQSTCLPRVATLDMAVVCMAIACSCLMYAGLCFRAMDTDVTSIS